MHQLIAGPFMEHFLLVRPGHCNGLNIGQRRYQQLATAVASGQPPTWLAPAVTRAWPDLNLTGRPLPGLVLVRPVSPYGFARASDELNLRQLREAMINSHVLPVAPRSRWHTEDAGWNLLAFDYLPGARHADYTPGSPDLLHVVDVMNRLHQIPCPDLPLKNATQRWAAYLNDTACLAGDTLLHTDFNRLNILLAPGGTWIIDWAWPTRGAAFIDPACFILRLIASGHTAASAERWASHCDGWHQADPGAIDAFAIASARLYAEIARDNPQPWKQRLAGAAAQWATYRHVEAPDK